MSESEFGLAAVYRLIKKAGAERVFAATVARAFQGKSLQDNMFHVEHTPAVHAEEEVGEAVTASV